MGRDAGREMGKLGEGSKGGEEDVDVVVEGEDGRVCK